MSTGFKVNGVAGEPSGKEMYLAGGSACRYAAAVPDDMKAADVPDKELADAKFRVSGNLLMAMQTISEQASRRLDQLHQKMADDASPKNVRAYSDAEDAFRHEDSAGFVRLWGLSAQTWSRRQGPGSA